MCKNKNLQNQTSFFFFFFAENYRRKKITEIKIYRSKEKNVQKQKFTVSNFFYRKLPKEKIAQQYRISFPKCRVQRFKDGN